VSDQGKTYAAFVEGEVKAERERRATLDARGQALVTTSGALVTLLGGLAALVKPGTVARFGPAVLLTVCLALVLLAAAAACGILAGWNRAYAVATTKTLVEMTRGHWRDDEVDARNNVATVNLRTVGSLREANAFKARWISIGLIVQVSALLVLSAGIVLVVTTA
jgi:hypothetical protein